MSTIAPDRRFRLGATRACAASLLCGLALAACRRHDSIADVARLKLADVHSVVMSFHDKNGRYPADASELHQALDQTGWGESVMLDPWRHGFLYRAPGKRNPGSFDLCTRGPDGVADTDDDICVLNPGQSGTEALRFGAPVRDSL